ncbi:MAG: NAD(P)/FAD-dependent oxidoreductase [Bacteroidia bacterium]
MPFKPDFSQIIISGAGPAGSAASMFLSKAGVKHTLIEKAVFPRDKICGDALSGKVMSVLRLFDEKVANELSDNHKLFHPSKGVIFVSPNNTRLSIPFKEEYQPADKAPGYVVKRIDFDNFLFSKTHSPFCHVIQNCELKEIEKTKDGLELTCFYNNSQTNVKTKLLIAADGSRSIAAKKLGGILLEPAHYSGGIRAYYSGVKNLNTEGYVELIFIKKYLPGYFWIFPMPDGKANVGAGMLTKEISKKRLDLKKMMLDTIENDPEISKRFEGAVLEGKITGWGLPLGSKKRKLSGDNFILCGDAGSLIDPFTGEGIGTAMLSGKIAADISQKALAENNFSSSFMEQYDKLLYAKIWKEISLSYMLQKLSKWSWLFNFVVGKASRNIELQRMITSMFSNLDLRKQFANPMFYLRLLFKR